MWAYFSAKVLVLCEGSVYTRVTQSIQVKVSVCVCMCPICLCLSVCLSVVVVTLQKIKIGVWNFGSSFRRIAGCAVTVWTYSKLGAR